MMTHWSKQKQIDYIHFHPPPLVATSLLYKWSNKCFESATVTQYPINYVYFIVNPLLHISALAVILYMFVTVNHTHPLHSQGSQLATAHTDCEKPSLPEMGAHPLKC